MSTYCCTDLHGNYTIWNKIHKSLKENDTLYILGDVIDSCEDGIQILEEIMLDPRVKLLKGNHEELMYWACSGDDPEHLEEDIEDWFKDGGEPTAAAYNELPLEKQEKILNYINNLPSMFIYTNPEEENFYLSHAGFTPPVDLTPDAAWKLYWNREHLDDAYDQKYWKEHPNDYIVHGHTPIHFQNPTYSNIFPTKIYPYCGGHKINLDIGTTWSSTAARLNLDDWSVTYFYDYDFE